MNKCCDQPFQYTSIIEKGPQFRASANERFFLLYPLFGVSIILMCVACMQQL